MTYDAGPIAALRRIAFLLERSRAEGYKVRAFRTAIAALLPLGDDEIAARVGNGTLREIAGIGPSIAEVVQQAVAGEMPDRLARLEAEESGPLVKGGTTVRSALRGDLHSHSDWSDGTVPIEEMAMTAVELGHEYLVLTDHSPRLKVANGLTAARLERQLEVVDALDDGLGAFRLLRGIEVDILDDGGLDQTDEMLARLNLRVASVHSKLQMDADAMTQRMLGAVANPFTNVLGHCTGRLVGGSRGTRGQSQFDAAAVFEAAAEQGVAIEINARPERRDPPTKLLKLAIETGCLFSIDSDAHAPGQLDFQIHGCVRAEELGLDPDRIVNTWPADRLLTWAASRL